MKKLLLLACSMLLAAGAFAQGTVNFANGGAGVNAPIYYQASPNLANSTVASTQNGAPWVAMLFAGPSGSAASALSSSIVSGAPAALGNPTAGYVFGGARTISGIPSGTAATLQIRAWSSSLGANWDASWALDGSTPGTGASAPVTITLGGGPTPTPNMVGLTSFAVTPVPEPSTIALGLLGLGAVALFRRRK